LVILGEGHAGDLGIRMISRWVVQMFTVDQEFRVLGVLKIKIALCIDVSEHELSTFTFVFMGADKVFHLFFSIDSSGFFGVIERHDAQVFALNAKDIIRLGIDQIAQFLVNAFGLFIESFQEIMVIHDFDDRGVFFRLSHSHDDLGTPIRLSRIGYWVALDEYRSLVGLSTHRVIR